MMSSELPAVLTAAVLSVFLPCSSRSWLTIALMFFCSCCLFSLSYLSTLAVTLDTWDYSSSAGEGLLWRCCVGSQSGCISSSSDAGFPVTKCLEHTLSLLIILSVNPSLLIATKCPALLHLLRCSFYHSQSLVFCRKTLCRTQNALSNLV